MKNILHLKAPGNWINDPNGFIYYKGKYHLFYQYFPYAPIWGTMHWGHAISDDLVHWEHLGVAVFPTKYEDQNGCFSGSALEDGGKMNLYYTGVHYDRVEDENIHVCMDEKYNASQLMITSEDGLQFDNFSGKKVIIPTIEDEEIGDRKDTRDPKVWKDGGNYYMILGSTYRGEIGRALFYRSEDGTNWNYAAECRSERFGKILECPDIFKVNENYVFMGSPMYIEDNCGYAHHAICMPVQFDADMCSMQLPSKYQYVDCGRDLYAPQTNVDKEGRRVMVAWMRMPRPVEARGQKLWNGMLSIPRIVEIENEHIYFKVHPEVDCFFARELSGREEIDYREPYRLKTTLEEGGELDIGGFRIWISEDCVNTDRSQVFGGIEGHRIMSSTPKLSGNYRLDIFVDPNLIEIFVNEGQYVVSNVVYDLKSYVSGNVERIFVGNENSQTK